MKEIYYFGSFNPIHRGHIITADIASSNFGCCKVHITPTPCSPFKKKENMLPVDARITIINECIKYFGNNLDVSDIDIKVGKGKNVHYTYETLEVIKKNKNAKPGDIGLLFGSDVLAEFDKWKNWEWIYNNFTLVIYPRPGDDMNELLKRYPKVKLAIFNKNLLFNQSSTRIREMFNDFDKYKPELKKLYNNKCLVVLKKYLH